MDNVLSWIGAIVIAWLMIEFVPDAIGIPVAIVFLIIYFWVGYAKGRKRR